MLTGDEREAASPSGHAEHRGRAMGEYPAHLTSRRVLSGGQAVIIRPIRADDGALKRESHEVARRLSSRRTIVRTEMCPRLLRCA